MSDLMNPCSENHFVKNCGLKNLPTKIASDFNKKQVADGTVQMATLGYPPNSLFALDSHCFVTILLDFH